MRLDRDTSVVSYIPMPGEDMAQAEIIAPRAQRQTRPFRTAEAC